MCYGTDLITVNFSYKGGNDCASLSSVREQDQLHSESNEQEEGLSCKCMVFKIML